MQPMLRSLQAMLCQIAVGPLVVSESLTVTRRECNR